MRPSGVRFAALRKADAIYLEEVARAGLYDAIWQAFAVLLPVKTVGVMGDGRTYDNVCALRAVASTDGMTADYYPFPHEFLGQGGDPHHQRGARHQPRGLRRDLKAAGNDRVGVSGLGRVPVPARPNLDTRSWGAACKCRRSAGYWI